jgi:probable HAF family extracellular repeat protein
MHKGMTILAATLVLGGLFVASSTLEADAFGYTFTDLNVPGSQPDSTGTGGVGLNNLGQIVGNYYDSVGNSEGFLYTGGKYVTIDEPGATDTYLYGINDFGQILGVSVYFSTGKSYVFLDTHGTFTNIADPSVFFPLLSLNDRDQALGEGPSFGFGVLNAHGVITPTNLSGAPGSAFPDGLNNLGQFTGTVCDAVCHGFIDTKDVFTKLDYPNATFTGGNGINDWGQVVGVYSDGAGDDNGFLYTNGHFTTIDDPNSFPPFGTDPLVINDLGQTAGWYYDAQENMHSFLATPNLFSFATNAAAPLADTVPEPSTWAMMLFGFAGLGIAGLCRARTGHATIAN